MSRTPARPHSPARRRTARVIHEASHELGRIEERGEAAWRKMVRQATKDANNMTKDAQGLLRKLERSVKPARAKKKKAARKKVAAKKA